MMYAYRRCAGTFAILGLALLLIFDAKADTTAFGLTIGSTTEAEMKSRYRVRSLGINRWSEGAMFEISPRQVGFDGLQELTAIYDQNQVLVVILADFNKRQFGYLNELLASKYELLDKRVPRVGDKYAHYRDGDIKIELDARHMSFKASLSYFHQTFLDNYKRLLAEEQKHERQGDASKL